MSIWYCIPSKRPPEEANEVLKMWRERGYKIFLIVDDESTALAHKAIGSFDDCRFMEYRGYANATNTAVKLAAFYNPDAEWFVLGGDDIEPDPNHSAEEIARECAEYFTESGLNRATALTLSRLFLEEASTFGVMQPTGDKFGDKDGPYIERVCGSPWIGREFARRINQGRGPLWPEYYHMGEDEELQAVAQKYGVLWQRPDLIHYHRHWGRPRDGERMGMSNRMPDFLKRANSPEEWHKYKRLLAERQAGGFPGSEPIP